MRLIADSHLDLAWNALVMNRDLTLPLAELNAREREFNDAPGRGLATTTLPVMRSGSVALCLGTLVAGASSMGGASRFTYSAIDIANAMACGQHRYYQALAERGEIRLIEAASQLDRHAAEWRAADDLSRVNLPVGLVIAFEGCDAVTMPSEASLWYERGVRCASLVHYGKGRYSGGTGTNDPLTTLGRELLAEFSRLGIVLDVTHLSDRAFADVIAAYDGPIFASHQNCRALVPRERQFTDEQITKVIERGGVVGVACDNWMLAPEWPAQSTAGVRPNRLEVPIDRLADHIDHVCQLAGNARHAAIGSDLDGGFGTEQTPAGLDVISDLQKLDAILTARGYASDEVDLILGENWIRFLASHLPS